MKEELLENNRNWLAFYTKSRSEKQVFNRLEENDFEAFLPLITHIRQWSDRKKKVKEPLIRSYVFVRVSDENIIKVLKIPGVVGILKYLGKPAIVKEEEIENLRILVNGSEESISRTELDGLKKGDAIEVIKGPFLGLRADYVRLKGQYRAIVKIKTLGAIFSVDIPGNYIKKL